MYSDLDLGVSTEGLPLTSVDVTRRGPLGPQPSVGVDGHYDVNRALSEAHDKKFLKYGVPSSKNFVGFCPFVVGSNGSIFKGANPIVKALSKELALRTYIHVSRTTHLIRAYIAAWTIRQSSLRIADAMERFQASLDRAAVLAI